jgi:capsular polysaccharide biosynthesis protein
MEGSEYQKKDHAVRETVQISNRDFWMVIFLHKWTIVIAAIIMFFAITWGLSLRQERYVASVKFWYNRALPQQTSLRSYGRLEWEEEINSLAEVGRSHGVLEKTAIAFDTARGWEDPPRYRIDEMCFGLSTMIEVVPVPETNIINIMVRDTDADTSLMLADIYGKNFVAEFNRINLHSKNREYFEKAILGIEKKIMIASSERAQIQEDTGLYSWRHEEVSLVETQASLYRDKMRKTLARTELENSVNMEMKFLDVEQDYTYTSSLRNDNLISKVRHKVTDLTLELAEVKSKYTPEHPVVIAKTEQLEAGKQQLKDLIELVVAEHGQQIQEFRAAEDAIVTAMDEVDQIRRIMPEHSARLEYLDDFVKAQWRLYYELIMKYNDTLVGDEGGLMTDQLVSLGPPNIGGLEGATPKAVIVVVAPIFALLLAIAIAFMAEATNHSFQKAEALEEFTGIPVLAVFKKI